MWSYISIGIFGFAGIGIYLMRRCFRGTVVFCHCKPRYKKNAVITGANSGIGKSTAIELARRNWNLVLGCRDVVSGEKARLEIIAATGNRSIVVRPLDLSSPESIHQFCSGLAGQRVDVLVNNAGMFSGHLRTTPEGIEETMAVNHLGHFLLTNCLLPQLIGSPGRGRVVIVASSLARQGRLDPDGVDLAATKFNSRQAYANSKLANCLFARELHRRYHSNGRAEVNVYCLQTSGMIYTNLFRHQLQKLGFFLRPPLRLLAWLFFKTPYEGCQTVAHCALSDDLEQESGLFYSNCESVEWPATAMDDALARAVWEKSEQIMSVKKD